MIEQIFHKINVIVYLPHWFDEIFTIHFINALHQSNRRWTAHIHSNNSSLFARLCFCISVSYFNFFFSLVLLFWRRPFEMRRCVLFLRCVSFFFLHSRVLSIVVHSLDDKTNSLYSSRSAWHWCVRFFHFWPDSQGYLFVEWILLAYFFGVCVYIMTAPFKMCRNEKPDLTKIFRKSFWHFIIVLW